MKKTGLALFLALAAVFFVAATDAAAANSNLNYSEKYQDNVFCEEFDGELFCDVGEPTGSFRLLATFVGDQDIINNLLDFPDDAFISIFLLNRLDPNDSSTWLSTTIDIPFANFPSTCFNGRRTCVGAAAIDEFGTVFRINARATNNTLRFTLTGNIADLSAQAVDLFLADLGLIGLGPINDRLEAWVTVSTLDFNADFLPVLYFNLPLKGSTAARVDRRVPDTDFLKIFFRAMGKDTDLIDIP